MRDRVLGRLQELDEEYPPSSLWRALGLTLTSEEGEYEVREWKRVRMTIRDFLEIDGVKRMASFKKHRFGERVVQRMEGLKMNHAGRTFRSTTFIPSEVKHTLPLYLEASSLALSDTSPTQLTLLNPLRESEKRVVSYIKYLSWSRGILYHILPSTSSESTILQLVLPVPPPSQQPLATVPAHSDPSHEASWLTRTISLLIRTKRSVSVPPKPAQSTLPPPKMSEMKGAEWVLKCWANFEMEQIPQRTASRVGSRASSRRGSVRSPTPSTPPILIARRPQPCR